MTEHVSRMPVKRVSLLTFTHFDCSWPLQRLIGSLPFSNWLAERATLAAFRVTCKLTGGHLFCPFINETQGQHMHICLLQQVMPTLASFFPFDPARMLRLFFWLRVIFPFLLVGLPSLGPPKRKDGCHFLPCSSFVKGIRSATPSGQNCQRPKRLGRQVLE